MNSIAKNLSQVSLVLLTASIIYQQQKSHNDLAARNQWDKEYDFIVVSMQNTFSFYILNIILFYIYQILYYSIVPDWIRISRISNCISFK